MEKIGTTIPRYHQPLFYDICLCNHGILKYIPVEVVSSYAKQKHPGYKKVRGQSEAALQIGMCDQKL